MESVFLATLDNYRQAIESPASPYLQFPKLSEFETRRLPELRNVLISFLKNEIEMKGLTYTFNMKTKMIALDMEIHYL